LLGRFTFRPVTPQDEALLREWIARPHVAEWWDDQPPDIGFIAHLDGRPIGFIQSYEVPDGRGIDQFLANADDLNRGIGTEMIRAFLETLFADPSVRFVQVDPAPNNARAIRCYEKVGFTAIGEIDTPDGRALLMKVTPPLRLRGRRDARR
jgi:RimJ/RimL family protein N-acetyltransferase